VSCGSSPSRRRASSHATRTPARRRPASRRCARTTSAGRRRSTATSPGAAGLSLAGGTALLFTEPRLFAGEPRDFRLSFAAFNLIYGALNTAFVAANLAGIAGQREGLTNAYLLAENRRRQARALAANAGLDMIYIAFGLTLWATDKRPIVRGMGLGVALQGAVLLGFDGGGALLMSR
jgi:hypothetical protein